MKKQKTKGLKKEILMQSISIAQWTPPDNEQMSYSIFGLGKDGKLYRFDRKCTGWIPLNMKEAKCAHDHKY